MTIHAEVSYSSLPIYGYSEQPTEHSLELRNIHPQQIKWFDNCMEEFWKAQQWLATEYRKVAKDVAERYE